MCVRDDHVVFSKTESSGRGWQSDQSVGLYRAAHGGSESRGGSRVGCGVLVWARLLDRFHIFPVGSCLPREVRFVGLPITFTSENDHVPVICNDVVGVPSAEDWWFIVIKVLIWGD